MPINPNILLQGQVADIGGALSRGVQTGGMLQQLQEQRALAPLRKRMLDTQVQQAEAAINDAERNRQLESVYTGYTELNELVQSGDFDAAAERGLGRLSQLRARGQTNTSDTQIGLQLIDAMSKGGEVGELAKRRWDAYGKGLSQAMRVRGLAVADSGVDDALKQRSLDLRQQELELKQATERRQAKKMSAVTEKALLESQDFVVESQRSANEFNILADQYEELNVTGGLAATTSETFAKLLGSQDEVSELRRRFNKIRLSEGLKSLPPGPATDRDVQEAFKGVPPENAPSSQVASFLRGASRLARLDAAYNQFKADFISEKRNSRGLNKEWRKQVNAPKLGRSVSMAEIYETAQNRGITPEDVKQQLGIQ